MSVVTLMHKLSLHMACLASLDMDLDMQNSKAPRLRSLV